MEYIKGLESRVEQLEFRQRLLFDNSSVDRLLFEYDITQEQYVGIMDLMDAYRRKIEDGEKISHHSFETAIYKIVPQHEGNYHFCEFITKDFRECGRWEEVFPALYGDLPKYQYLKESVEES